MPTRVPPALPAPPAVRLPQAPAAMERTRVPIIAVVAPVVFAGVLYVVTGSTLALVFAFLGPIIAVGTAADFEFTRRRRLKRDEQRFAERLETARVRIRAAHDRERADLLAGTIAPRDLLHGDTAGVWRATLEQSIAVCVGTVSAPSRAAGASHGDGLDTPDGDPRLLELARELAVLEGAPLVVDAREGVAIVGRGAHPTAVARSIAVQLTALLPPDAFELELSGGDDGPWVFVERLPHRVVVGPAARRRHTGATHTLTAVAVGAAHRRLVVTLVDDIGLVPLECSTIVEVGPAGPTVRTSAATARPCDAVVLSSGEAEAWGQAARLLSARLGVGPGAPATTAGVVLGDLIAREQSVDESPAMSVRCGFSHDGRDAHPVDIVADGPHALVTGLTGSGKSELLTSWILAMCAARPPGGLDLLLVDFKGGAQFDALASLPHVVGVITDLDASVAARTLASLSSELVRRECALRTIGVRSIDEVRAETTGTERLSRLVVVVDEFAVVLDRFPHLGALFVDIAARGRSLGVHLILCTQRVTGVVRESLLANLPLRMCLRVTSAAESTAVIGTPAAASLSSNERGLVFIQRSGETAVVSRVALSAPGDVDDVAERWTRRPQHRPWLPPLPAELRVSQLPESSSPGLAFGLTDEPDLQRYGVACHDPRETGGLAVIGPQRSGKSTAIRTLAAAWRGRVVRPPRDAAAVWDAIAASCASLDVRISGVNDEVLVLIDDLDAMLAELPEEYHAPFLDRVERVARRGRSCGVHVVVALTDPSRAMHRVTEACAGRLVLGAGDAITIPSVGDRPAPFGNEVPPGRGRWRGREVHVAVVDEGDSVAAVGDGGSVGSAHTAPWRPSGTTVVVSTRPTQIAAWLTEEFGDGLSVIAAGASAGVVGVGDVQAVAIVGDPDAWQANWMALAALRPHAELVFDGCSLADVRAIARTVELPPPFARHARPVWSFRPDGTISRIAVPSA